MFSLSLQMKNISGHPAPRDFGGASFLQHCRSITQQGSNGEDCDVRRFPEYKGAYVFLSLSGLQVMIWLYIVILSFKVSWCYELEKNACNHNARWFYMSVIYGVLMLVVMSRMFWIWKVHPLNWNSFGAYLPLGGVVCLLIGNATAVYYTIAVDHAVKLHPGYRKARILMAALPFFLNLPQIIREVLSTGHITEQEELDSRIRREVQRPSTGFPQMKTVGELIDELPIGLFHVQHYLRMMYCWICICMTEELTPYVFPALRRDFSLNDPDLSYFSMSFQFGAALSVIISAVFLDQFGRRRIIVIASPLLVISCGLMLCAPSYPLILFCRIMVSFFGYTVTNAYSPWFTEFLPTRGRGVFLAAISFGWPMGRSTIILIANFFHDKYHPVIFCAMLALVSLMCTSLTCLESPRFLIVKGDYDGALAVLRRMYEINGTPFDETIRLQTRENQARTGTRSLKERLRMIFSPRLLPVFLFAVSMVTLLACSSMIIDTWGPTVYARLLSPETPAAEAQLPHMVLLLFSFADITGIAVSVFLTDLVGRQCIMFIGFLGQGSFMALMSPLRDYKTALLTSGFIGTSLRCFAWEGTMMWTLEAFPTELRATAFSLANACMRFGAVVTIHVSGLYIDAIPARVMVLTFAAPLLIGAIINIYAPCETANVALVDHVATEQMN